MFSIELMQQVLILVVVEDVLVLGLEKMMKADLGVLILVVVEDVLVLSKKPKKLEFADES